MEAPQSGEDVESVVRELRLLDPLLGVRWEPKAVMMQRGGYTAEGKVIAPVYRGLWEIIRDDDAFGTAPWRSWTRICFVTEPVAVAAGITAMEQDGAYAPLGAWLVTFLREADTHNRAEARRRSAVLDAMDQRREDAALRAGEDGEREILGHQYFEGTKAGGGVSEFHPVKIALKA